VEEHESKAVQAVAGTGGKVVDAATEFGRFLGKVLGTVPQDAVGVIGGDWLHEFRARNLHRMQQRTEEILGMRETAHMRPVSPTLAIPLFKAAQDESRSELQELWARLLANAMDKTRSNVRRDFIEILQKLEPLDAAILNKASERDNLNAALISEDLAKELKATDDQIIVSLSNMRSIGCFDVVHYYQEVGREGMLRHTSTLSAYGRELVRAVTR